MENEIGINEILSVCDHTLLSPTATWEQIKAVCEEAILYKTASACIPPSFVRHAKEHFGGELKICTVIGFPNGYSAPSVKLYEAIKALEDGADEIDMVINLAKVKEGLYGEVLNEIKTIRAVCHGKILKVIIEVCYLTDEEKIKLCEVVTASGADYIKTSTGFGTGGATAHDVKLFKEHVGPRVKIKAAGGISSLDDAREFITLGAHRLGTSRIVKLAKGKAAEGY